MMRLVPALVAVVLLLSAGGALADCGDDGDPGLRAPRANA